LNASWGARTNRNDLRDPQKNSPDEQSRPGCFFSLIYRRKLIIRGEFTTDAVLHTPISALDAIDILPHFVDLTTQFATLVGTQFTGATLFLFGSHLVAVIGLAEFASGMPEVTWRALHRPAALRRTRQRRARGTDRQRRSQTELVDDINLHNAFFHKFRESKR
jgi:hypothetical protein